MHRISLHLKFPLFQIKDKMGDLVVNEFAHKLTGGAPGDSVMRKLRERGYSLASMNSISSRIRSAVLASCAPPDYSELRSMPAEQPAAAFLAMSKSDRPSTRTKAASTTASVGCSTGMSVSIIPLANTCAGT